MGLKLTDFTKVNKLIFTTIPFNFDDEILRDNKIFGMKIDTKKRSLKNNSKSSKNSSRKKQIQ